jgi:hypothetical protein
MEDEKGNILPLKWLGEEKSLVAVEDSMHVETFFVRRR